jgi:hypothetical protein
MTAEQHRRQAEMLLKRGGEENGALALHHEQLACLIDKRNGESDKRNGQNGKAADAWNEAEHPRGQPGNAGQFGSGGGGGGKKAEAPAAWPATQPDPNQMEMILEPKFRTKTEHVKHLLTREGGTTIKDVLTATGWPSVSMPQMAKVLGLKLEKIKEGGVTKYKGIPLTEAEKAEMKRSGEAAKKEKAKQAEQAKKAEQEAEKRQQELAEKGRKLLEQTNPGKVTWESTAKVSPVFTKSMTETYERLPAKVREALDKQGTKIKLGQTTPDAFPDLEGKQPRGWDEGTTWANCPGVYSSGLGYSEIGVAEKMQARDSDRLLPNLAAQGVMRHEVGHAWDHALGHASSSPAFVKAYDADVGKLQQHQKPHLKYFLQPPPPAGRSEAFAELFACIHSRFGAGPGGYDIRHRFPETTKVMMGLLSG